MVIPASLACSPARRCPSAHTDAAASGEPDPSKWTHYALEPDGNERLTRWMREHLRIAVWASDGIVFLHDVEHGVMRHWQPPLNLTGVAQPYRRQVRTARAVLAERAAAW